MFDKRYLLLLGCFAMAWLHDGGALAAPCGGPGAARQGCFDALTYNVAGLPEGISESSPALHSTRISPLLNAYDLVCLQEDFCYHDEVTGRCNHPFRTLPQATWTTFVNDGLTLLSRFPLAGFRRVRWPIASGVVGNYHDCWASKGFCVATVELAIGVTIDVYDLHGDAGVETADKHARLVCSAALAEHLAHRSHGRAVIVAGDFNLDLADGTDRDLLDDLLQRNGLCDAAFALGAEPAGLDRFLFRSSDVVELTPVLIRQAVEFTAPDGQPLSDHPAMHTRWRWRQRCDGAAAGDDESSCAAAAAGERSAQKQRQVRGPFEP